MPIIKVIKLFFVIDEKLAQWAIAFVLPSLSIDKCSSLFGHIQSEYEKKFL